MRQNQILPVIIGTGLSGMAISRVLSDANCQHFLIGSPPNKLPRLGESINFENRRFAQTLSGICIYCPKKGMGCLL